MISTVAPRVERRVIMKVSITASGLMPANTRLVNSSMTTRASRHTQGIAAHFDTRFVDGILYAPLPLRDRRRVEGAVRAGGVSHHLLRPGRVRVGRPGVCVFPVHPGGVNPGVFPQDHEPGFHLEMEVWVIRRYPGVQDHSPGPLHRDVLFLPSPVSGLGSPRSEFAAASCAHAAPVCVPRSPAGRSSPDIDRIGGPVRSAMCRARPAAPTRRRGPASPCAQGVCVSSRGLVPHT